MNIALVGTDSRAAAIGRLLESGGYDVRFADDRLNHASESASPAPDCAVLVLAGPRHDGAWPDRRAIGATPKTIVVDAMDGRSGRDAFQRMSHHFTSNRIVRALIALPTAGANIPCCSDDDAAMHVFEEMLHACGCVLSNRGPLANADELEPPDRPLDREFQTLEATNTVGNSVVGTDAPAQQHQSADSERPGDESLRHGADVGQR